MGPDRFPWHLNRDRYGGHAEPNKRNQWLLVRVVFVVALGVAVIGSGTIRPVVRVDIGARPGRQCEVRESCPAGLERCFIPDPVPRENRRAGGGQH